MKMRKLFFKLSMLLFVLGMSTNAAWGQEEVKIYFASLKAQSSPESTGSGQVKLTWVDITGAPLTVELAKKLNSAAFQDPTWMAKESAYDGFGETAQVLGGTMSALDGMETMIAAMPQIFMTSLVYYYAQAQPANGSYLAEWTFTEPAITRMPEPMGGSGTYVAMYNGNQEVQYDNPLISPCFKVLPDSANNAIYSETEEDMPVVGAKASEVANTPGKYNNLYAVFNKYLLSNPQAENGHMNANESSATFKVSVDVEGDASQLKADYADFDFPASDFVDNAEGTWSWAHASENPIENISSTKTRYNFTITFTPKTTDEGRKNATLTIRMAHADASKASTLNIPLSVDVRPAATADATLYDGKTPTETSGTLSDMIAAAHNTDKIVVLNRDYADVLVLNNKNVTIDLNGYDITNTLTVSGGDVTIAYSKFGGQVSSVVVASGKLTLNGGTIETSGESNVVAVTVMPGATLVQNGAKIIAEASQKGAVGIYNLGTVTINEGSIYAESGYNTAVAVNAENGSTTYINGGSLSALAKEEDGTEDMMEGMSPAAISTWTNAYAVNVAAGSTVEVNGGDLYAEATNAGRAYGVATLAGFGGNLTVNKKAVIRAKSPNYWYSFPVAVMAGKVTINGGKFDGHYTSQHTGDTINPAVFGVDYSNFTFISGTCKTDVFFIENPEEAFAGSLLHPSVTLYKVTKGSKDYNDGYRNIAVADTINGNPATQADRIAAGVPAARIGTTGYTKLEDAIAYANNNPSEENIVIFMTNDYTLPAGYYTLPANATIVVPMSDDQAKEVNKTAPRVSFNDADRSTPYVQPTEFRRLTIASGVNMDVFGNIEMTCSQFASNEAYTGQPTGAYGHIVMEEGSHMTLQDGSEVRAWGYMTGKGEIDARRGSIVREMFQLGDWKGAMTSVQIVGLLGGENYQKKIFPVTQYFIQNIESPVKYHPGSLLSTSAAVSEGLDFLSVSMTAADIGLIGVSRANSGGADDPAIFLMDIAADAENTWVRKWYDAENDIQVYDINSGAHIGSMVLDMGELFVPIGNIGTVPIKLNSSKFDLPLTCNFKIHLLTGGMDFKQNTSLLPGAEVEVDKEATVSVAQNPSDPEHTGALYVYDAEEWGKYAYGNSYGESAYEAYTKVVRYAPSWNGRPTKRDEQTKPASAKINVHGTFKTATGFVYTSESGANIFSSNEDAGTFIFNDDAENAGTREVYNVKGSLDLDNHTTFYPAKLKNGNGEHVNTGGAEAGDAYCYINDEWTTMYPDEDDHCFMVKHNTNGDIYYAKPAEYVAVVAAKEQVFEEDGITPVLDAFDNPTYQIVGNADHTYSDAAGAGRLFILMDNCQWWEVEKKDNLYHCIHPDNDTYYYWGEDNNGVDTWIEKKFTITWLNWDGTAITTNNGEEGAYKVTYGTMAEFLGTNPTRPANIDYTYDFTGWTPALGPVTNDVTYTATYTQKPRMYTIVFLQEGGVEIERHFLTHNEVPVCENIPTKVGHTLEWSPAIAAVTGDATYTATWLENPPTEYKVVFLDFDGDTLQQGNVEVGSMPTPPADPTGKATWAEEQDNKEFTYVFDHWSPALEEVSATSIKSYTAVYAEVAKTYTVKFVKENGDPNTPADVIESHQYQYGETPMCANTPTKDATAQYTYSLRWIPQIQTVMADANYTAVFDATTNKYTVTLKANPSGACTFSGAGTFDYGTAISISRSDNDGYTFTNWTDKDGNTVSDLPATITADINLVANFTVANPDYTITWKSFDGNSTLAEVEQKANTATIYTGTIPTKAADADSVYTFDGWTTEANGAGTFYKNNMTPKATANATYYAHFAATEVIMEIGLGQAQNISEATTVNQLILNSNGIVSGQLTGVNLLNVTGDCYYDLTGTFTAGKWYAVAVPWQVTAGMITANGYSLSWNSGNYLAYYDGSVRAAQGKVDACWKYVSNSDVLVPGRLYMLYLENSASVLRFPKKAGAGILTTSTNVSAYGSAEATDANWNGISNPAIFYAYISNTGATVGQVFNADAQSYQAVALSNKLIVAKPIFVQATNTGSAVAVTTPPASAPARRNAAAETLNAEYQVEIASYGRMQDRLFINANEDKEEDTYTIGQDVLKFGISDKVAQMWVDRYDTKLCMNTMAPVNSVAEFPLSIFAPRTGEYTISIENEKASEDHALYLTYNGEAIWNLSEGEYTANLSKGTEANYGLRISIKNAPQVETGVDEAIVDAQGETRKVLINNQVFIIRGNKVYSIDGQLVK